MYSRVIQGINRVLATFLTQRKRPLRLLLPVLAILSCYEVASKKASTSSGSRHKLQQQTLQRDKSEGLWGDASFASERNEDWGGRDDTAARSTKGGPGKQARDRELEASATGATSIPGIREMSRDVHQDVANPLFGANGP